MPEPIDAIALTRELIAFDTINPPGQEAVCIERLAAVLGEAGLATKVHAMGPGRANLVATIGEAERPALCFTGHVDTVPLGLTPWTRDPFAGEIAEGRLYGRGASDMKAGVAAFVAAVAALAPRLKDGSGVALVITAGEETGCDGAAALSTAGVLPRAGALVVAEPTANMPVIGHKGALWLRAVMRGVTAHGSMPHLGVNAAYKAARALAKLEPFEFNVASHPALGKPTLNVGAVRSGLNVNSVPDRAEIDIDIRSIPALAHARAREQLQAELGDEVELETLIDVGPVWTEPSDPWIRRASAIAEAVTGEPSGPSPTAPYFTDASVLTPALGNSPTLILGPGEPSMAHQTDEYCLVERVQQAVEIYRRLLADACGL